MKISRVVLFLFFVTCCLGGVMAKKKAKKGKQKAQVAVVDTFSYACGKANTQGLKAYLAERMGVDTTYIEDFILGFEQDSLTEADKRAKARLAGVEIRQQVENQMIPAIDKQISDTTSVLAKDQFVAGFREALSDPNIQLSMDTAVALVAKQSEQYRKAKTERLHGANRAAGQTFLSLNAQKEGVQTTKSGLQYKVITQGTGEIPQPTNKVKVHYEGRLIDGTVFDSSYQRNEPAVFPCGGVIKGWTEALTMMPVGSKWELYIPSELAYGEREMQKIPPYSVLVFTVELLDIEK